MISLLLLTHNSSQNLKKLWTWLKQCPKINEIVAIDDNSTDNTVNILKSLASQNLKVVIKSRGLVNNFSAQRQFGLEQASNNWILWLDSDEKPSASLITFLNQFNPQPKTAYSFPRQDYFLNRQLLHGETANIQFIRIFHKNHGKFIGQVHEVWKTTDNIIKVHHPILHFSHPNFFSLIQKINFYSDIRANELYQQKINSDLPSIILYPVAKFFHDYFFRLGFLDSLPGLIIALSMSFHSFLVRSKLWHLQQK